MQNDDEGLAEEMEVRLQEMLERQRQQNSEDWITRALVRSAMVAIIGASVVMVILYAFHLSQQRCGKAYHSGAL
jgi:anti-sigma-K factor RskA